MSTQHTVVATKILHLSRCSSELPPPVLESIMAIDLRTPNPPTVIAPPFTLEYGHPESAAGRGRLELARPGPRGPGLHRRLGVAQPERVRRRPRPDSRRFSPASGSGNSITGWSRPCGPSPTTGSRVRFQYEWHDAAGHWHRSYGNELWEFDERGLMRRREASINDVPILESRSQVLLARSGSATGGPPRHPRRQVTSNHSTPLTWRHDHDPHDDISS